VLVPLVVVPSPALTPVPELFVPDKVSPIALFEPLWYKVVESVVVEFVLLLRQPYTAKKITAMTKAFFMIKDFRLKNKAFMFKIFATINGRGFCNG
jgi:hypothetical protein